MKLWTKEIEQIAKQYPLGAQEGLGYGAKVWLKYLIPTAQELGLLRKLNNVKTVIGCFMVTVIFLNGNGVTFFYQKYDVDFNGWHVDGDFLEWNFDVYSGDRPIIRIQKEWLA